MTGTQGTSLLQEISNALVNLHKEQFGRGPTRARSYFAGPDMVVCALEDVLLPAEKKMIELGDRAGVREVRTSFQAATSSEFTAAIESIVHRKVYAFANGIDPDRDVVFVTFYFERESGGDGDGALTAERASELR
jgi:uncharacterized protein YbcI